VRFPHPPACAIAVCLAACGPQSPAHAPMTKPRAAILAASESPISYQRIADFPPPGWHVPRQARISPDGRLVTYLASETQTEEMALFAMDLDGGERRVLVRARDLVDPHQGLSREEELRRERQRKRIEGVTAYAWAAKKNVMLLPLGGHVFVRRESGEIAKLTSEPAIDPQICADGSRVAFSRGPELYVVDVAAGAETQLTVGAPAGVTRGQSDFNGQEEFAEASGLWWSPTCDRIAYLEVDERDVADVPIVGYRGGVDLQLLRYPRAGAKNPRVRLGIVDVATKKSTFVQMPPGDAWKADDQYLGRVAWAADGEALYLQRLSRDQKHLGLLRAEADDGAARELATLAADAWIDLADLRPLDDGSLLWLVRRDDHRHIERLDGKNGTVLAVLTSGAWDVSQIVGVDEKAGRVVFVANADAPLDRQVYARKLDGSGALERLTPEPGVHEVDPCRAELGFVDVHSAADRLPLAIVRGPDGKQRADIPVQPDADLAKLALRVPEIVAVDTPGGPTLYGAILKPRHMDPGVRYPAVVVVYGGPGVQTVKNEWNPRLLWQHLADRGVIVFQLDNRGSAGRGYAFEKPIHRRMGEVELADQLRGLDWLEQQPYVDSARLGIYGHSYGGFMAVRAMLVAPGRFKAAAAGSPVIDWRLYDTGYTERFMESPQANAAGYDDTELSRLAPKLEGKLLLIHALMDENVHFANTARLIDALVAADKDFELLVFPGERHGYRSPVARRYAYRRVVEFFAANL
jgi:dipeptidyl-peptidase 4